MKIVCFIALSLLPVALSQNPINSDSSNLEENVRVKRAGFSLITGAIQNLQKSAFSASASLSAGSSASSSSSSAGPASGSSSSHDNSHSYESHSYHNHEYETNHDTKSFDGWQLKKSILNTLLQAVKAIAGGVTTLKGQLIKGSGYLVSQKGKLIASAGDSVSNAGKSIINSAHLIKPEDSGHGQSFGHSLGSKFGGLTNSLTKSISGLSAGSAGSITSLSSSSSAHGSGSSSGSSSSHGESYTHEENHGSSYTYNIPESNSYGSYDTKPESYGPPKIIESYGPPRPTVYFQEPQSVYGTPEYHDGSYKSSSNHQEASDVLSEILQNLPHKPMKTVGYESYSGGHSFNQIPIPNDPPPFNPLNTFSYKIPLESPHSEYGPPLNSFSDFHGQSSNKKPVAVNPKAYDIYHSMKLKMTKEQNFVTLPSTNIDNTKGLEIQKSIQYEIKA